MVETIKLFTGTDVKPRENKTSVRDKDAGADKAGDLSDKTTQELGGTLLPDESVSIITSQVASSNAQAARADVANQEDADKILQQLGELIRNNAEMAESAQANISPRMVLNLFATV